jgi:hypothetical protein
MARPLSEEKRTAILEATAEVVAMLGVSAPTAKIAKEAGVAEGTLFTYFANKDELLNGLYLELKMGQLAVSDRITEESKKLVGDAFGEFDDMMRECAAGGAMRHQPPSFVSAIMSAIGDTTMDFIMREPAQAKRYTKAGFDAFWNAVAG